MPPSRAVGGPRQMSSRSVDKSTLQEYGPGPNALAAAPQRRVIFDAELTADLLQQLQAALGAGYRFDRELGGGGMSRVFLAEETGLARRVVVKVLPPELGAGVNVDRFRRETQLAASLQHPHIVPLLTAGAAGDLLYYTMPFIEGESLRARLAREHELPVRDAVRILRDVADALAYAHGRGVMHRDIKPDNVLLSGGHALVADFGIAKALSQAAGSSGLTSVGVAIGTPTYMAPEQAAGDPAVDHRADIYAFGAMAYEMLGGRPPFAGLSPHQTLAAHVTEKIEPVTKHRSQLPRPLAELVMWCLEKNPADRPQTAAELVPALEGLTTRSGRTASVRFGKRAPLPWRRIAIAAAALVAAGGAWLAFGSRRPELLDADRIAIAPFDVLDPALGLWREGLMDVLSRSLDGAGPLRTISPTLIAKRWGGRADATSAQALGRQTGARTVVYGQLLGAGSDSVRLLASILDVKAGTRSDLELRGAPDRIDRLADSLTVAVLRTLGHTRAIAAVRGTSLGSSSLPALKAFLQGEQFLRRSQYDSALSYHQQAITLDSTFTLALSHASMASGWQHSGGDTLTRKYALAAGRLNRGLAPRESILVLADSLTAVASGGAQSLGGAWWTYGKRLLRTLDDGVRRYPDDPEMWYSLGDARYHLGVTAGVGWSQSLEAFDRAIALDSSFSPAYIHAVGLSLQLRGPTDARRYIAGFLKSSSEGRYAELYRLADLLIDPKQAASSRAARLVDSLAPQFPYFSALFDRWPDSGETYIRLARGYMGHKMPRAMTPAESSQARQAVALGLAYRGHLREAARLAGNANPLLYTDLAYLGVIPGDSAQAQFDQWSTSQGGGSLWALGWAGTHRDTTRINAIVQRLSAAQGRLPPTTPPIARDVIGYLLRSGQAYAALARGDSATALRQFTSLPDSACFNLCGPDELVRAQLLESHGRTADALQFLDRHLEGGLPILPSEIERVLVRGRLQEKLGRKEAAATSYNLVIDTWLHADSSLQGFVREARAGLSRLGAERRNSQ